MTLTDLAAVGLGALKVCAWLVPTITAGLVLERLTRRSTR